MALSRIAMELVTAGATGAAGVVAVAGGLDLGAGWSDHGPEAGYFPFWVGLILLGASLWNMAAAVHRNRRGLEADPVFLHREQLDRIVLFLAPITGFVLLTVLMGTYVATTVYLAGVAWWQGGLRPHRAVALGIGFSLLLYVVFELLFQVPLFKGPLEDALGIY